MFGIKKNAREKSARFHKAIANFLSPHIQKIAEKIKLNRRIRIANIWAKRHPKTLMTYYIVFAICLIAITLISDLSVTNKTEDVLDIKSIPSMSHRLKSLNNTEIQNEKLRMEIGELGRKGQKLYNELDSMMQIPNKSHEDSLKIYSTYKTLNETFNNQRNELKKD